MGGHEDWLKDLDAISAVAIGSYQEMAFLLQPPRADDAYVNPGQGA